MTSSLSRQARKSHEPYPGSGNGNSKTAALLIIVTHTSTRFALRVSRPPAPLAIVFFAPTISSWEQGAKWDQVRVDQGEGGVGVPTKKTELGSVGVGPTTRLKH